MLFEGAGELVGARCAFNSTLDAFEPLHDLCGSETLYKQAYAFEVAVATTYERYVTHETLIVNLVVDLSRASAACRIAVFHFLKNFEL